VEERRLSDRQGGKWLMRRYIMNLILGRSFGLICRFVLAAVFIYAAVEKISDPARFSDAVAGFRILPLWSVNIFAIILPWMELLAGLSLIPGVTFRSSALLLIGLSIMFIGAVGSAMVRGLDVECGCFTLSHAHSRVGWGLIGRDMLLLCLMLPLVCVSGHLSKTVISKSRPAGGDNAGQCEGMKEARTEVR